MTVSWGWIGNFHMKISLYIFNSDVSAGHDLLLSCCGDRCCGRNVRESALW